MIPPLFGKQEVGIWWVKKRFPRYGVPIWSLWPNIRFLPSIFAGKNAAKNEHICSICIKINKVGKQEVGIWWVQKLVVHRSSETSTNQSDVIIRSDDRFLNHVVDSDSIVSKIYILLNFVLWLHFFSVCILTKILQFYPSWFFLSSYWQTSGSFVQAYFWHSVNTHIWTSLLFIYFPE